MIRRFATTALVFAFLPTGAAFAQQSGTGNAATSPAEQTVMLQDYARRIDALEAQLSVYDQRFASYEQRMKLYEDRLSNPGQPDSVGAVMEGEADTDRVRPK